MSANSKIEWTNASWNPVTGCDKISPGCARCYAATFAERFRGVKGHPYEQGFDLKLWPERLELPKQWKKPRMIFVNSMSDWLHKDVPDEFIFKMLDVMVIDAPWHTYQLLTKRAERLPDIMKRYLYSRRREDDPEWWLRNLWIGVSVENQKYADERIPHLLQTPSAIRWVSCEPLLGPINLRPWLVSPSEYVSDLSTGDSLDWVVVGGESGYGARPMHPDWVRSIRDQCQEAGTPFFFKQWGAWVPCTHFEGIPANWQKKVCQVTMRVEDSGQDMIIGETMFRVGKKISGRLLDGREWSQYPV